MTLLRVISGHAAVDHIPSVDEWRRIVILATDLERDLDGDGVPSLGRPRLGIAQRNTIAVMVAKEMRESGASFADACKSMAQRCKNAGIEGGDRRTVERCCHDAARKTYPEYCELFGLTTPKH
jgi:hypothetical protein